MIKRKLPILVGSKGREYVEQFRAKRERLAYLLGYVHEAYRSLPCCALKS